MMDGREFIDVAQHLAGRPGEASIRSSISRSYCAAYNYARSVLRSLGFKQVADGRSHDVVCQYLQNCGESTIQVAGRKLGDLEHARLKADYALDDNKYSRQAQARLSLMIAKDVVDALATISQDANKTATVKDGMEEYNRKRAQLQDRKRDTRL